MPTVPVIDNDLEGALAVFKHKTDTEGVLKAFKERQAFVPNSTIKARQRLKQRQKANRKRRRKG